MSERGRDDSRGPSIRSVKRRNVSLSADRLVVESRLDDGAAIPLVLRPAADGLDLVAWAQRHRDTIEPRLSEYGALLFRGFAVSSVSDFERFVRATARGDMIEYEYASTPRARVSGKVYTSTEYPAEEAIPLHNEMSYARRWPLKAWFFCVTPADRGGETPIADSRKVLERIDPAIREEFTRKRVQYVRNYGSRLDLSWRDVFNTDSREGVESFCASAGIEVEWFGEDRLRTRQVCQAVARHPKTGDQVWFNQAHLFHITSLRPEIRELLLAEFSEEELPRNAVFGDRTPIDPAALDAIRLAYAQEAVASPWSTGDVLLVDNMLIAHGRAPFEGSRRVVVGLAEPFEIEGR